MFFSNHQILTSYQKLLQYVVLLDKLSVREHSQIGYYKSSNSPYWNFALVDNEISAEEITEIEKYYDRQNRSSTIYFESNPKAERLINLLRECGYLKYFEDSWMFWNKKEIDDKHFNQVKEVISEKDVDIFVKTYDACYQKDDDQNPYGQFDDTFLQLLKKAWLKYKGKYLDYFILYENKTPVGVSILVNYNGLGYITAVGSKKSVRGRGYGKAVTLFAVQRSLERGNKLTFLGTEEGFYPNEFYNRLGFQTKFKAFYFVKNLIHST